MGWISSKQLEANRRNAGKAGVKTEEGKRRSRLNARKHGIFASALTERDEKELRPLYEEFAADLEPRNTVEEAIVEKLALTYLRLQRCARAEAEYHRETWYADQKRLQQERPGPPTYFRSASFRKVAELIRRYDTSLTNQFFRLLHELERMKRMSGGDRVPAPVTADVSVSGG